MDGRKRQPALRIGEFAKRLGLNVRTLRYYEDIGLLPAPARTEGGYRLYTDADERLLRFVLQAKAVGFHLDEIRRIIELRNHGPACGYVRETVRRHIAAVEAQIAGLRRVREQLAGLVDGSETNADGLFCGLIEKRSLSPRTTEKETDMVKRTVEVFTAGCPVCEPAGELVQRVACESCDVRILNVKDDLLAAERARAAGVNRVPMVLVDGQPATCCGAGPITEEGLRAAGIGAG